MTRKTSTEKLMAGKMAKEDKRQEDKKELVKKIQEETRETLLPSIKGKMEEVSDFIIEKVKEDDLSSIQIMSLIARKSLSEIALGGQVSYTPQEIAAAFNIYLDMVDRINKVTKFPPTIHSFTTLLGITPATFNNWRQDPDKREICEYIHSYFIGSINEATLLKEVETIAGIYTTKTMGLVEQVVPMVIEHKKTTNVDEIQAQLQALKKEKVIDAEWEEKE